MTTARPFVKRLVLENYKNIAHCDVSLGPLVLLVGPNGSGKSNFLDALRFVAESLRNTMDRAFRERGGISEVRRRSQGHPTHFRITLELSLPDSDADYSFRVGAQKGGGFEVQEEQCRIRCGDNVSEYRVKSGEVVFSSFSQPPPASTDRLYLTLASGFKEFGPLYQSLIGMGFYNINPQQLRDLQDPDSGELLARDGSNAASVLMRLLSRNEEIKKRIEEYLAHIVPGIRQVDRLALGHKLTLEFKQNVAGDKRPWNFSAQNMSDGTLRALGVLVSVFQCLDRPFKSPIPLVAIEEPETALHPAAAGILMDALREASEFTQVLVTSHSPDLLDDLRDPDALLIFRSEHGQTTIGPADQAALSVLSDNLYTAGELLRLDQLQPRAAYQVPIGHAQDSDEDMPLFRNSGEV